MQTKTLHCGHLNRTVPTLSLLVAALALPILAKAAQPPAKAHPRYKLIDLGTFGGPSSIGSFFSQSINNRGTAIGVADTTIPDPSDPNCFAANCLVQHAFQWKNGVLIDLGALSGGGSSQATWINQREQIVGFSQYGLVDPLTGAPAFSAVLWQNGEIINLGTLGGNWSIAVLGTRGHMLAMYVCFDNPTPMVADYPAAYEGQPGFDFLKRVPTWWDETRVLADQIGELLVVARRKGKSWYVGGMSAGQSRQLTLPIAFLGAGRQNATIWKDAPDANQDPNKLVTETLKLSSTDTLKLTLAVDGRFVAHFEPMEK